MNSHEARRILQSSRAGGQDDRDPLIAEALEQTRCDPELRRWFEEQRAFDAAISSKLRELGPPPDLRQRIASALLRPRSRRPAIVQALALAAILVLLGVVAFFLIRSRAEIEAEPYVDLRRDMAAFLVTFPRLDLETERLTEVQSWLTSEHGITGFEPPGRLGRFPSIGCRTVRWGDQRLALICFMVDGEVVHLFVMPVGGSTQGAGMVEPHLVRVDRMTTATWQRGDVAFLAVTKGDAGFLRSHL
jgi:hypothetical protein